MILTSLSEIFFHLSWARWNTAIPFIYNRGRPARSHIHFTQQPRVAKNRTYTCNPRIQINNSDAAKTYIHRRYIIKIHLPKTPAASKKKQQELRKWICGCIAHRSVTMATPVADAGFPVDVINIGGTYSSPSRRALHQPDASQHQLRTGTDRWCSGCCGRCCC